MRQTLAVCPLRIHARQTASQNRYFFTKVETTTWITSSLTCFKFVLWSWIQLSCRRIISSFGINGLPPWYRFTWESLARPLLFRSVQYVRNWGNSIVHVIPIFYILNVSSCSRSSCFWTSRSLTPATIWSRSWIPSGSPKTHFAACCWSRRRKERSGSPTRRVKLWKRARSVVAKLVGWRCHCNNVCGSLTVCVLTFPG